MKISTKQIIQQAFLKGRTYHSPLFKAKYLPTETILCAVVVGKKQLPRAVDRNRTKRRIVSLLQKHQNLPSGTLIILAHKNALHSPYQDLKNELQNYFDQLSL